MTTDVGEELRAIDELIHQAEDAVKALRRRKQELLDTGAPEYKEIAALLHKRECKLAHEDMCAWYYEREWEAKDSDLAEDVWVSNLRASHRWLKVAQDRVSAASVTPQEYLAALKVVSA